jgi:hypothetical protein
VSERVVGDTTQTSPDVARLREGVGMRVNMGAWGDWCAARGDTGGGWEGEGGREEGEVFLLPNFGMGRSRAGPRRK